MQKAYFSNIRSQIIAGLRQAKNTVSIAMAWFTCNELFDELISCIKRGVRVELILQADPINFMGYAPDFNDLIEHGGILRLSQGENSFLHHKFCIIDDKTLISGSYNWTYFAETRNIENIIISDDSTLIAAFNREFKDLQDKISSVETCPKLDWCDIEQDPTIDFQILNYEIERIARVNHLPERKVIKSNTQVYIEDRPLRVLSKYSIGLGVNTGGVMTIIDKGTELPFTSQPIVLYNYADNRKNVECSILYQDGNEDRLITKKAITDITGGRDDWELKIKVQFTLLPSGDLNAEVSCMETGKVLVIKTSNPDLISYDE